jgi:hypothetical protein
VTLSLQGGFSKYYNIAFSILPGIAGNLSPELFEPVRLVESRVLIDAYEKGIMKLS